MKSLFNYGWIRALYQILVVGIICLPYRLVALVVSAFNILMMPVQGISLAEGFGQMFGAMVIGYKARAYWVKTGEVLSDLSGLMR